MKLLKSLLLFLLSFQLTSQSFDPKTFSSLKFRFIGPDGNRMIAAVGEPMPVNEPRNGSVWAIAFPASASVTSAGARTVRSRRLTRE